MKTNLGSRQFFSAHATGLLLVGALLLAVPAFGETKNAPHTDHGMPISLNNEPAKRTVLAFSTYRGRRDPRRLVVATVLGGHRTVEVTAWGKGDGSVSISTWLDGRPKSLTISREVAGAGRVSEYYSEPTPASAGVSPVADASKSPLEPRTFTHKEVSRIEGTERKTEQYVLGKDGRPEVVGQKVTPLVVLKAAR